MDFQFSPEDEAFREEVKAFFKETVTEDTARSIYATGFASRAQFRRWQKSLFDQGWGAPHWPVEYGGTDWSPLRKHIFMEELYNANGIDGGWQGLHMVGPVIIAFGSEQQKKRFLLPMLSGEEFWCQGFSEPGAGSDLANLRTRAVLEGGQYVVNGQKIWTSEAVDADWGFFLVRTDPDVKPQRGISFLLIDMNTPGITVRPIKSIDGKAELNEVFLEDVRVPAENLVGEAGKGWTYAKYLLEKERTTSAFLYFNKKSLARAREIASGEKIDGVPVIERPEFQRRLAEVESDLLALEWSVLRILAAEDNKYNLDAVVSALKLRGSVMQQRVTELQLEALGAKALRFFREGEYTVDSPLWPDYAIGRSNSYMQNRASTIYGGTQEIQKNIIAKIAFGL